ncbi:MAG: hypothetical protein LWW86_16395 [Micrococcales bacterium]|nr:hypothetical protein [Micrococcales bacterium]
MKYVILAILVFVLIAMISRAMAGRRQDTGAVIPVTELPPAVITTIDHALDQGKQVLAIKLYRDATKAPLGQAKEAIDVHSWKREDR